MNQEPSLMTPREKEKWAEVPVGAWGRNEARQQNIYPDEKGGSFTRECSGYPRYGQHVQHNRECQCF